MTEQYLNLSGSRHTVFFFIYTNVICGYKTIIRKQKFSFTVITCQLNPGSIEDAKQFKGRIGDE